MSVKNKVLYGDIHRSGTKLFDTNWLTAQPVLMANSFNKYNTIYAHCPHCGEIERHMFLFTERTKDSRGWCGACHTYSLIDDWRPLGDSPKWIVQLLDGTELSVVRTNNGHGRLSHGWFDENKQEVAELDSGLSSAEREGFMKLAEAMATERNRQEGLSGE